MELVLWPALAFVVSLAASWAGAGVALAPLRAAAPTTWFDRARLAFPARATARFALLLLPFTFGIFAELFTAGETSLRPWLAGMAAALAAFAATFFVRVRVERAVHGKPVGGGEMLRGMAAFWAVLFPHVLLTGVAAAVVGDELNAWAALVLAGTALSVGAAMLGTGVAFARLVRLARPASEKAQRAVVAASATTGVRPRGVYELDLTIANAFALPAVGSLLFTPPLVRALDDAQLAAIARHELGHVSEPRSVVAVRVLSATVLFVALVAVRPILGPGPSASEPWRLLAAALTLLGALAFTRLVGKPVAQRMEERADAIAAKGVPDDGTYARALEAVYAANLVPAVMNVRGAHPHLYDRMVSAGLTPSWPRPAPPSRPRLRAAMLVCLGITIASIATAMSLVPDVLYG